MSDMSKVLFRVSAWNSVRYERQFVLALAISLLQEELDEFSSSTSEVGRLDGLCDASYVAFGCIWKLDITAAQLDEAFARAFKFCEELPNDMLTYNTYARACVDAMRYGADPLQMSANIVTLCLAEAMDSLCLTYDEFIEALNIVCDSNDTKQVVKTAADVKANITKGASFVPPTAKLQDLLNRRIKKVH